MGQVNLLLIGREFASTTALRSPSPAASSVTTRSTAAHRRHWSTVPDSFVRAAAIELPRGMRVNSVSPTVLVEAMGSYAPYFRGYKPVAGADVGLAYAKSVEGLQTGQTFHVG